ncbi:MAG TPA: molybdenum cofactor sulfurase [Devosia sp.]|nr:molybdenum cofactor sulfurase [Devosia sp.]
MVDFVAAKKKRGTVAGLFVAAGRGFVTEAVDRLTLTYEGIPGDRHAGLTRKSNAREPWHKKGTEMRNEQQVSILADDELIAVASELGIDELKPEWIGGNMVLSGIPFLSQLPPRTLLMFEGGVTIRIDGDRGPCRYAGRSIADQFQERDDIEFAFPKVAEHRRGLVGWVEVPGVVRSGESVTARIWEQCIYPG